MKEACTDDDAAEREEGVMHIGPTLIADAQAAEGMEPGEGALDHPAMTAEPLAGLEAATRDAWNDAALP